MPLRQHCRYLLPINLLRIHQRPVLLHKPSSFNPSMLASVPLANPISINTQQHIIPTHHPLPHLPGFLALGRKRPVFQPITSLPLHVVVGIFIFIEKLHGDLIRGKGEQFLAKAVAVFFLPFAREEGYDFIGA